MYCTLVLNQISLFDGHKWTKQIFETNLFHVNLFHPFFWNSNPKYFWPKNHFGLRIILNQHFFDKNLLDHMFSGSKKSFDPKFIKFHDNFYTNNLDTLNFVDTYFFYLRIIYEPKEDKFWIFISKNHPSSLNQIVFTVKLSLSGLSQTWAQLV